MSTASSPSRPKVAPKPNTSSRPQVPPKPHPRASIWRQDTEVTLRGEEGEGAMDRLRQMTRHQSLPTEVIARHRSLATQVIARHVSLPAEVICTMAYNAAEVNPSGHQNPSQANLLPTATRRRPAPKPPASKPPTPTSRMSKPATPSLAVPKPVAPTSILSKPPTLKPPENKPRVSKMSELSSPELTPSAPTLVIPKPAAPTSPVSKPVAHTEYKPPTIRLPEFKVPKPTVPKMSELKPAESKAPEPKPPVLKSTELKPPAPNSLETKSPVPKPSDLKAAALERISAQLKPEEPVKPPEPKASLPKPSLPNSPELRSPDCKSPNPLVPKSSEHESPVPKPSEHTSTGSIPSALSPPVPRAPGSKPPVPKPRLRRTAAALHSNPSLPEANHSGGGRAAPESFSDGANPAECSGREISVPESQTEGGIPVPASQPSSSSSNGDSSGSPLATPTCSTCCPCVCHHGPDTRYDAHAPDHRSLETKHAPESKARYDHCSLDHRSPAAKSPEYKALHLCTLEAHSPDYCSPESTSIHESMPRHGHSPQPMPKDAPVPNHHSPESKARYDHHLPDDHLLDDPSLEWKLICDAHKLPPVPSECQEAPYLEYWYIAQPKMPENQRSQQRSPPSIPLPSLPRMELPLPSVPCIEMSITGESKEPDAPEAVYMEVTSDTEEHTCLHTHTDSPLDPVEMASYRRQSPHPHRQPDYKMAASIPPEHQQVDTRTDTDPKKHTQPTGLITDMDTDKHSGPIGLIADTERQCRPTSLISDVDTDPEKAKGKRNSSPLLSRLSPLALLLFPFQSRQQAKRAHSQTGDAATTCGHTSTQLDKGAAAHSQTSCGHTSTQESKQKHRQTLADDTTTTHKHTPTQQNKGGQRQTLANSMTTCRTSNRGDRLQQQPTTCGHTSALERLTYNTDLDLSTDSIDIVGSSSSEEETEESILQKEDPEECALDDSKVLPMRGRCFSLEGLWQERSIVRERGILNQLSREQILLQESLYEVVTSERSYLRSLDVVCEVFLESSELRSVLEQRDSKSLFSGIHRIRQLSQTFLQEMCEELNSKLFCDTCEVIQRYSTGPFSTYVDYIRNMTYQQQTLRSLEQRSPQVFEVIRRLQEHPRCNRLSLKCFLVMPFQRITRLRILVEAILKRTEPGSQSHASAQRALNGVCKIVEACNREVGKMKQMEEIVHIANKTEFECKALPLVSSSRWLLKQGELYQLGRRENIFGQRRLHPLYLFLFNDLLLLTTRKGPERFVVRDHAHRSLLDVSCVEEEGLELEGGGANRVFQLALLKNHRGGTTRLLLQAPSPSEKASWMTLLRHKKDGDVQIYEEWDCPQVQCVSAYQAQHEGELTLQLGDVINVVQKTTEGLLEGWRVCDGERGWFPAACVLEIPTEHVQRRHLRQRYRVMQAANRVLNRRHGHDKRATACFR
ncbi:rho guanine nucleotide exchange factor 5 [Engraulis encrasicolus]|uniref:rho guanine nucleotide exchange factor 5 n=1 Tax=Engraulis encrasicolus TaxID=184585 RepID=UPI002FCEADC4